MTHPWLQGVIVGLIVVAAFAYLLRKYLPRPHKAEPEKKACGNCGGCSGGGCH